MMSKILLVQHNLEDNKQLEKMLHLNRFNTVTASTVTKAINFLNSDSSINLIITSINMSMDSRWDIVKHVKQDQKLYYIPIIMTSDNFTQEDVLQCAKYRINELIAKPFTEDVVISKVQKAITSGKPTVLLVDDDEGILEILRYVIELERISVLTATSAEQGLELLKDHRVDAIITDIMLPGITGLEFMVEAKERYNSIPVILISACSINNGLEYEQLKKAEGFFAKPFNNRELVRKLKQVMPIEFWRTGAETAISAKK